MHSSSPVRSPPKTPSRKRKNEETHESPYFSPPRRKRINAGDLVKEILGTQDTTFPTCLPLPQYWPNSESCSNEDLEGTSKDDPLSLFYSRTFSQSYEELEALKPILIQEQVADDKWKLLIAVTLLNKTSGKLAIPVFWDLLSRWPTPWVLSQANQDDLVVMLTRLGTQTVRAKRLIELSRLYLQDPPSSHDLRPSRAATPSSPTKLSAKYPPTPISHLPGAGPYALDSYRIFCTLHDDTSSREWQQVMPSDKELIRYLKWRWAAKEHKQWSPNLGVGPPVTLAYLKSLKSDLSMPQN